MNEANLSEEEQEVMRRRKENAEEQFLKMVNDGESVWLLCITQMLDGYSHTTKEMTAKILEEVPAKVRGNNDIASIMLQVYDSPVGQYLTREGHPYNWSLIPELIESEVDLQDLINLKAKRFPWSIRDMELKYEPLKKKAKAEKKIKADTKKAQEKIDAKATEATEEDTTDADLDKTENVEVEENVEVKTELSGEANTSSSTNGVLVPHFEWTINADGSSNGHFTIKRI